MKFPESALDGHGIPPVAVRDANTPRTRVVSLVRWRYTAPHYHHDALDTFFPVTTARSVSTASKVKYPSTRNPS